MNQLATTPAPAPARNGLRAIHLLLAVLVTLLLTAALTFWFVRSYIYARDFEPVELDAAEQRVLDDKLQALGYEPAPQRAGEGQHAPAQAAAESDVQWLRPEPYREDSALRRVEFSERELNALIANDRALARRLSVDLSDDLVSARLLVPLEPDFPLLGGKTLRVSAGVEMAFANGRPRVVLKGVSLMGVPIPGAWLGGLKNIDLISEFGDAGGFWQGFAEGVEDIRVEQGRLRVELKP